MYSIENKADLCPICKGSGKYFQAYNYGTSSQVGTERTCHGCNGKGWVIVPKINNTITGN